MKPLLQIKQSETVTDPFQCLVMRPIYASCIQSNASPDANKDYSEAMDVSGSLFRSFLYQKFVGISVLVATVNDGYLYQFTNNGRKSQPFLPFCIFESRVLVFAEKWTMSEEDLQSNCLVATYPFTSPIIDVNITDYVVHALTDHGIETYTHRIGHKLFSSAYEYNLRDDPFYIEVSEHMQPRSQRQLTVQFSGMSPSGGADLFDWSATVSGHQEDARNAIEFDPDGM